MEHFSEPEHALREMARVVKPGGAIWIFFTPHFSPLGSHLYDYIYTPWCHLLFTRGQLQSAIRTILRERTPDAPREQTERGCAPSWNHTTATQSYERETSFSEL
jgi:ubiquinone/menaquinone biosynthesis C-methylase UbiE